MREIKILRLSMEVILAATAEPGAELGGPWVLTMAMDPGGVPAWDLEILVILVISSLCC